MLYGSVDLSDQLRSACGYIFYYKCVMQCWDSSCLGLALGLDLVSTPQCLGLVLVSLHSGRCHNLVSVLMVLITTLAIIS